MLPLITAWAGHTEASRAFVADLLDAIGAEKKAAFAEDMGLTPNQLSNQLAGVQPMNVFRLVTALVKNPRVQVALLERRAQRIRAELITAEHAALIRGAVSLGKKKMAQILPSLAHERKAS